jgi:hypothetical protein
MDNNDYDNFGKLISGVFGVYGKNASDDVIEIYYRTLKEYSIEDLSKAFTKHLKNPNTGNFLPTPSEIIKIIEGDSKNKSMIAWDKAINAIDSSYDVVFDDPIIHAVIRDMGGWVKFCFSINDFNKDKIEIGFRDRYKNYVEYGLNNYPKILKGNGNFLHSEAPRFIGDKNKALEIMNNEVNLLGYQE